MNAIKQLLAGINGVIVAPVCHPTPSPQTLHDREGEEGGDGGGVGCKAKERVRKGEGECVSVKGKGQTGKGS